jgi:hypothetical protein
MTKSLLVCGVVATWLAVMIPGQGRCGVVINEIMADPASDWSPTDGDDVYDSLDDEWIEIHNAGAAPVDITGWRLRDAVSDSSWRYGFQGVIPPGAFLVVYGDEAYCWEDENGYSKNGLSMNNAGDTMTLVAADLVTVIDEVSYSCADVLDDRSYGRMPDGSVEWVVFDGLNPMNPVATDLPPTPGSGNAGAPVEACAWGHIKALYR